MRIHRLCQLLAPWKAVWLFLPGMNYGLLQWTRSNLRLLDGRDRVDLAATLAHAM
jgi:hypothetical protein